MKSLCRLIAVLSLCAGAFGQVPAPPTFTAVVAGPKPVNVHIVGRHAEGWYPGARPRLVTETHSWFARHLLGRHNASHYVMPPPPAGLTGCRGDNCIFTDNWSHNLRTTGGADWQANAMGTTGAQPATATYIALTNDATAAAAGDCAAGSTACTLASEVSTNGLARHVATYAHTNGTNTWSLSYTWTASGTQSVQKAGMFNASSSGTMTFEANFTQVNLVSTDTFTETWTVTY